MPSASMPRSTPPSDPGLRSGPGVSLDLPGTIGQLARGVDLTEAQAEAAFAQVMAGSASPVQMAALLVGLAAKGHAASEVAGGVRALRGAMLRVPAPDGPPLVDTCGTGGGGVTTFNISTAAALVAAGAGVRVAKHGNRSFTSRSGSADVLEALGVTIQLTPQGMGRVLAEAGIVFMFAPLLHPAMRHVGPVRRELGIPTLMNLLGPLTNPAGVRRQVVGVSQVEMVPLVVEALAALKHDHALVVHGRAGMDEVSPFGPTLVAEWDGTVLRQYDVSPEDFGMTPADPSDIAGGDPDENAARILGVLRGEDRGGARTVTLLNAAAALRVGGVVADLAEGVERATVSLDEGAALATLERLRDASVRAASEPPTG